MKYNNFEQLLLSYKNLWDKLSELADMGFDLYGEGKYDLMVDIEAMLYCQIKDVYTDDGVDWVSWFIFENEFGSKDWSLYKTFESFDKDGDLKYGAFDEDDNPICYDIKSTWEYLEKNHKLEQ